MQLTNKQINILSVLVEGNGRDPQGNIIPVDLDELLERLTYETTKASMQFSIRALIKRDLIYKAGLEKRRGRQRVLLMPTQLGRDLIRSGSSESIVEAKSSSPGDGLLSLIQSIG